MGKKPHCKMLFTKKLTYSLAASRRIRIDLRRWFELDVGHDDEIKVCLCVRWCCYLH